MIANKNYAKSATLEDFKAAVESAGFRIAPDYHGTPVLWCKECGRDSGYHWDACSKSCVKKD